MSPTRLPARREGHRSARGERAFMLGAGVHQQVSGHDVAFEAHIHRQIGQAPVDAVDHLNQ